MRQRLETDLRGVWGATSGTLISLFVAAPVHLFVGNRAPLSAEEIHEHRGHHDAGVPRELHGEPTPADTTDSAAPQHARHVDLDTNPQHELAFSA